MEAMAPDEMDQDHRQKSGREELEDTVQDQVRAEEHEIRQLREEITQLRKDAREKEEEIRGVKKQIANASGTDVRKLLEEELQFLRQVITSRDQQITSRDQRIISLHQQRTSRDQQIISLHQQITSRDQEISSLHQQITSRDQLISSRRQELSSPRSVQEAPASAEPPVTVETVMKLVEDAVAKFVRDGTAKSAISTLSMSSIATNVADNVLKVAGFSLVDGSAVEPAGEVSVSKEWEFDMGRYAGKEESYVPFLKHMVEYLNAVHAVQIRKDPPIAGGCCRLLDVHKLNNVLELEAELGDRTLKITGNLDAVFVPRKCGVLQFVDSLLGGVKVKHLGKETFKHGAPTVGNARSGRSALPGQALMEALAVYAYSDFPEGIFLLTSYDENVVLKVKDEEICFWGQLNFAQAMDKIAAFLKREDVQIFLDESEKPVRSRKRPDMSESKRSVRRKLNIEGFGNEEFLAQGDVIRSAAGSKSKKMRDLFDRVESWRSSTSEACGSAGPLGYCS